MPICLISAAALAGFTSRESEFLGSWVNMKNRNDTFHVTHNGDEFLIVCQDQKPEVGAIYGDGTLEIKSALLSPNLTCVKQTGTIVGPGFFG
jgi:hypothetical protein